MLTPKKKTFAEAILRGETNKKAAVSAGYSEATASQAASRLVKDLEVGAYIAKAKAKANGAPVLAAVDAVQSEQPKSKERKDPKDYLFDVIEDRDAESKEKLQAAAILMPYLHAKIGEGGVKNARQNAAKIAGQGRFKASPAPPLQLVKRN